MRVPTKQEIEERFSQDDLWPNESLEPPEFEVDVLGPDRIIVTVKQMYESPGLTFLNLQTLCKFFETENIDTSDTFGYEGCETCDYKTRSYFDGREYAADEWIKAQPVFTPPEPRP